MDRFVRVTLTSLVLALAPETAVAQSVQSGQSCARIESDLRRLICYDQIFRPAPAAAPSGKANRADAEPATTSSNASRKTGLPPRNDGKSDRAGGRFVPNLTTKSGKADADATASSKSVWSSSVTGDGGYVLRTRSKEQHRNIIGQQAWLELVVSCEINTTSLSVSFGGNIVASVLDSFKVTLKVDSQTEKRVNFAVSKDFKAVGLWKGASSIPVIKGLFSGTEVQITGAPFFSRTVTASFPITGLEAAIKPLRSECGW
ncbi:MAG: type VI secretion system-associated protein TagO [Pseudomonadota bacterium]